MTNAEEVLVLIVRDRMTGVTQTTIYTDHSAAVEAYDAAERSHADQINGGDPQVEVVLVAGESLDEIQAGFPKYFRKGSRGERRAQLKDRLAALA